MSDHCRRTCSDHSRFYDRSDSRRHDGGTCTGSGRLSLELRLGPFDFFDHHRLDFLTQFPAFLC